MNRDLKKNGHRRCASHSSPVTVVNLTLPDPQAPFLCNFTEVKGNFRLCFYNNEKFQKMNSLVQRKFQAMIGNYVMLPCNLMNNHTTLSTRVEMDVHAERAPKFQIEPSLQ